MEKIAAGGQSCIVASLSRTGADNTSGMRSVLGYVGSLVGRQDLVIYKHARQCYVSQIWMRSASSIDNPNFNAVASGCVADINANRGMPPASAARPRQLGDNRSCCPKPVRPST